MCSYAFWRSYFFDAVRLAADFGLSVLVLSYGWFSGMENTCTSQYQPQVNCPLERAKSAANLTASKIKRQKKRR